MHNGIIFSLYKGRNSKPKGIMLATRQGTTANAAQSYTWTLTNSSSEKSVWDGVRGTSLIKATQFQMNQRKRFRKIAKQGNYRQKQCYIFQNKKAY